MRQPAGSILQIPKEMAFANVDTWERSMIGFFVSYKMPFYAVNSIAQRAWKPYGLEKVSVLDNGFMVFRFKTQEAVGDVLAKGPWLFGGKTILLQKWYPGFQFDKNKIRTIPVWARLQGLPFPLWNKQGLSMAASMVGTPLACDTATLQCTRMEYARVCIELDASLPPVHSFKVASSLTEEPITVDVVYEWKPTRCSQCKVFGHSCKTNAAKAKADDVETKVDIRELEDEVSEASVVQRVHSKQKEKEPVLSKPLQHSLDKGKLPQCVESKMDTISSSADPSEGGASSSQGKSTNANNTPSPKAKKKKGKKKRGLSSRQAQKMHEPHFSQSLHGAVKWDEMQFQLDNDPSNAVLKENEREQARVCMQLRREEESFFKQRIGIKITDWNRAAIIKQLWNIAANNRSVWVNWVKANLLKGRSLWAMPIPGDHCGLSANGTCSIQSAWELVRSSRPQDRAEVWKIISRKVPVQWPNIQWDMAWNWVVDEFSNGHQAKLLDLALAATIYHFAKRIASWLVGLVGRPGRFWSRAEVFSFEKKGVHVPGFLSCLALSWSPCVGVFGLDQMAHHFGRLWNVVGACGLGRVERGLVCGLGVWCETGLCGLSSSAAAWLASVGGASAQVLLRLARRLAVSGAFGFSAGPSACFFGAVAHVFCFSLGLSAFDVADGLVGFCFLVSLVGACPNLAAHL
uniref:DUF4283 domain-containing protein n=1 Tax=Salix viminalis TaxID=40686 RepID=A0A6N2N7Y2_SALVM